MTHSPLEFSVVRSHHVPWLGDFFQALVERGDDKFFHPHPLTAAQAHSISLHEGRDCYCVAAVADRVLAYGMLRGWDEGYQIPSLGIALHPEARGTGLARAFMLYLHQLARCQGAPRVRLRVFHDNLKARRLYESLGYVFNPTTDEQLVGYCDLKDKPHA